MNMQYDLKAFAKKVKKHQEKESNLGKEEHQWKLEL